MDHDSPTLWPAGTAVRIVKLAAVDDPQHPNLCLENWKAGQHNEGSPPVDYELRGCLIEPLEIGKPIHGCAHPSQWGPGTGCLYFHTGEAVQKWGGDYDEFDLFH
jgi:hypothetical protein